MEDTTNQMEQTPEQIEQTPEQPIEQSCGYMPDIETVESSGGFDKLLYEGQRVKIGKLSVDYVQDVFPDGITYTPDSTKKKWVLKISTEPLKVLTKDSVGNIVKTEREVEFKNEDGTIDKLEITVELNFQNKKDEYGTLIMQDFNISGVVEKRPIPVMSKAPKAGLWKFCRKMGVTNYKDLQGKIVTLTTTPSKKEGDDRIFINIVTA